MELVAANSCVRIPDARRKQHVQGVKALHNQTTKDKTISIGGMTFIDHVAEVPRS